MENLNFPHLTKTISRLMKIEHHLSKVQDENTVPKRFVNMSYNLFMNVLPYAPTVESTLCKEKNAKTWKWDTVEDIRSHFLRIRGENWELIKKMLKEGYKVEDLQRAITVATRWCCRDNKRFKPDTAEKIKEELMKTFYTPPVQQDGKSTSCDQPSQNTSKYDGKLQTTAPPINIDSPTASLGESPIHNTDLEYPTFGEYSPVFTIHRSEGNKKNWTLTPTRPFLILGDSNIGRIPEGENKNNKIQIDAYPGAKLKHAIYLLKYKTPTNNQVEKVILSFGLNDRDNNDRGKIQELIKTLLETATSTFPTALIRIPQINYSPLLFPTIIENIQMINNTIRETHDCLSKLSRIEFRVKPDKIHWTQVTAIRMFEHWNVSFLE